MLGKLNRSGNEGDYEKIERKRKRRSGVVTMKKKDFMMVAVKTIVGDDPLLSFEVHCICWNVA